MLYLSLKFPCQDQEKFRSINHRVGKILKSIASPNDRELINNNINRFPGVFIFELSLSTYPIFFHDTRQFKANFFWSRKRHRKDAREI